MEPNTQASEIRGPFLLSIKSSSGNVGADSALSHRADNQVSHPISAWAQHARRFPIELSGSSPHRHLPANWLFPESALTPASPYSKETAEGTHRRLRHRERTVLERQLPWRGAAVEIDRRKSDEGHCVLLSRGGRRGRHFWPVGCRCAAASIATTHVCHVRAHADFRRTSDMRALLCRAVRRMRQVASIQRAIDTIKGALGQ